MFDAFQKRVDERVNEKLKGEYAKLEINDKSVDRWIGIFAIMATFVGLVVPVVISVSLGKKQLAEKLAEIEKLRDEVKNKRDEVETLNGEVKIKKDEIDSYYKNINEQKKEIEENLLEPIKQRLFSEAGSFIRLTEQELKQLVEIAQKPFPSFEMILTVSGLLSAHNTKYTDSLGYFYQLYILNSDSKQYAWFYAGTLKNLARYNEAESVLKSAVRKTLRDCEEYIVLRLLFAEILMDRGRYDDALTYAEELLTLCEERPRENHHLAINVYLLIGGVYSAKGEYDKALESYGKALVICGNILGFEHPNTATSYGNIGNVYSAKRENDKALEFYEKALAIYEKVLGPEHPDTATSYGSIGNIYSAKGENDKALEFYNKALAIHEKVLGPEHPDTATGYNNIGYVYAKGDHDKALEFYDKALAIYVKVLGFEHPSTATSYNNIGTVYSAKGEYEKAVKS